MRTPADSEEAATPPATPGATSGASPAAIPAVEPRPVRIVTTIVGEDGADIPSGMHFTCLLPDGSRSGGGSTRSPMDIETVEGARVRISASQEGFVPVLREITAPAATEVHRERIVLRRVRAWATLRFRIHAEETDLPKTVTVEIDDMAGSTVKPFYGTASDRLEVGGDRHVTLERVPPGEFRILAHGGESLESYLVSATATVSVEEGKGSTVDLHFAAGGRLLLRLPAGDAEEYWKQGPDILDAAGKKVGGLLYGSTRPDSWQNPPPRPGIATHKYGIPPGKYRVEFGPKEARRVVKEVEVRARETTEVDLTEGK